LALIGTAGLAAALVAGIAPATATFPGKNGRIAFSAKGDIFTVKPDTSARRRLTRRGPPDDSSASWSPNGRTLLFLRWSRQGGSLWSMKADGSRKRRLSGFTRGYLSGTWAPNGRKIVYVDDSGGDVDPRVGAIKVRNADGTGWRQLTSYRDLGINPTWSPDARKIAFVHDPGGDPEGGGMPDGEIYVMNSDGTNKTRLTNNQVLDETPAWSPDGSKIAFVRTIPGENGDVGAAIYLMNPAGTDERQVTNGTEGFDQTPQWSPNGRKLVFVRYLTAGGTAVCTVNPDGTALRTVAVDEYVAEWSPNSKRILLADGSTISVANGDGTGKRTIARGNPGVDWQALPLPAG
jgi:TolB protein